MTVRSATASDLDHVAELHAGRIREGFLTSLGLPFLQRLYRRVLRSNDAFLLVDEVDDRVTGFVAGVADLGALYRRFIIRDGPIAAVRAAPRLLRTLPRVAETLKYPSTTDALPDAEILAVAVAPDWGGQGIGTSLVRAATNEFDRRRVRAAKVVTTTDNGAAIAMYRACGFVSTAGLEFHPGRSSEVLVWTAS